MSTTQVNLRGFATLSFWAADHAAAKRWYTELLGMKPYFDRPGYCEFRIGDDADELGVIDARYAPPGASNGPGGAVIFWHVDDIQAAFDTLLSLGCTVYEKITPREAGFVTASVVDPFGNILGIMFNPHWLEGHAQTR
jgi:predicted enzyme related to lactoylglutathione lyase